MNQPLNTLFVLNDWDLERAAPPAHPACRLVCASIGPKRSALFFAKLIAGRKTRIKLNTQ